ncbi:hypothetical protein RGQ29_012631 [Quercus rubra]|uniref:Uncharacterized protein n=1 Tax=Quercus rubra TaxID=3512 RepID=A0AAN7G1R9_QUERU|nr:hypothetical protein RGQ29_012631 [Quercus rubra]
MRGTSKVIMGATLVMVVSLAIVVGLILVLLAELYCSLLLRRRQLRDTNSETATTTTAIATVPTTTSTPSSEPSQPQNQSSPPPLRSFYAQGVLNAPRSLLFPAFSTKEDNAESKKQHSKLHHIIDVLQTQETNTSPRQIGLLSASSSPPTPSVHLTTPKPIQEVHIQGGGGDTTCNDKDSGFGEHFMYISNPIYDNDARPSRVDTPFETPDTSPSRLEMSGSSGDDEVAQTSPCSPSSPTTPPLTPMKKLPAEACSVSLKNARSLGTSGSESNSNNGHSSSSSGSPCTSPSW